MSAGGLEASTAAELPRRRQFSLHRHESSAVCCYAGVPYSSSWPTTEHEMLPQLHADFDTTALREDLGGGM